jgi:predicted lactoylglutathione lyase
VSKSGENPPANVKSLGELVSWYENRQIISNLKEKDSNKMGQSYVGASKEELKLMTSNSKDEVVDLAEEAKKAGGNLSFDQILKIHGV